MNATAPAANGRLSVLSAVANPLNFMTLSVLIVEAVILSLLSPEERSAYLPYLLALLLLLILIVTGMAVWRPEALKGARPFEDVQAAALADDIYFAVDGYLQNLPKAERAEAWQTVLATLRRPPQTDSGYAVWAVAVATQLDFRAGNIRASRPPGPIEG